MSPTHPGILQNRDNCQSIEGLKHKAMSNRYCARWNFAVPLLHLFACVLAFASTARLVMGADDIGAMLQRGLFEEEANHDLTAAIKAYESVVSATDAQRKLASTAVFRLAECYRKLGRTNDAIAQYQRVLRDFGDQTVLVELGGQNLAALGAGANVAGNGRGEQRRLLELEIKLMEKELEGMEARRKSGLLDSGAISTKQRELLALRRQLAALSDPANTDAGIPSTDEEEREVRRIQALIKDSPDLINAAGQGGVGPFGQGGATPLHKAAEKGQAVVARFLLANKAEVNSRRSGNITPLHEAVLNGHKSMTDLLLANGAEVNASASPEGTPLHYAAARGFKAIVEVLLAHGANPNALDYRNSTPLHSAVSKGFKSVAEALLDAGADVNIINKVTESNADQYAHNYGTPLHIAAYDGHKPLAELLIARRAKVDLRNQFGETPLHLVRNNTNMTSLLIAAKADVNARVLRPGNELGKTPLCISVQNNYAEMVELLLENGADPNVRFNETTDRQNESTPLLASVDRTGDNERIVRALLDHKADTGALKGNGYAALHLSMNNGSKAVALLLLEHGADVEIRETSGGNTPLGLMWGSKELVELLLDHKANPNAQNNDGNTPLHRLVTKTLQNAQSSWKEIAELLIAHGANVNLRNRQGLTPLNLYGVPARPSRADAIELAEVLRQHGAKDEQLDLEPDPESIRVWRKGMTFGRVIFVRDKAGQNRFTLMEAILNFYGARWEPAILAPRAAVAPRAEPARPIRNLSPGIPPPYLPAVGNPAASWVSPPPSYDPLNEIPFPDLTRIRILRLVDPAKNEKKIIAVNFINAAGIVLCDKDVLLEFGDIIEIPEREYRLDEGRVGMSSDQSHQFAECLPRRVEVTVKGKPTEVVLFPITSTTYL
ncbi:MAG: hypothetical protein QOF48_1823, partial [Verrucomicrobiota bacterium]